MARKDWAEAWRAPGEKGMLSQIDPLDIPKEFCNMLSNANFYRDIGIIRKRYGFEPHEVNYNIPVGLTDVISLGFLTYTQVWVGGDLVNNQIGRLIAQVKGIHGFDFFWREYDFDTGTWGEWEPLPGDPAQLDSGETKADRVRWTPYAGILRGAAGNYSDSNAIWIGYIDRSSQDNNGYFANYNFDPSNPYGGGVDAIDFTGVHSSPANPDYLYDLVVANPFGTINFGLTAVTSKFSMGTIADYKNRISRYRVSVELDGHQEGHFLDHIAIQEHFGSDEGTKKYLDRVSIAVAGAGMWDNLTYRISGFKIYESQSLIDAETPSAESDPIGRLVGRIDARNGGDANFQFTFKAKYRNSAGYSNAFSIEDTDYPDIFSSDSDDLFNNMYLDIHLTDGVESHNITDCSKTTGIFVIQLNEGSSNLTDNQEYTVTVVPRWYESAGSYYVTLLIKGDNSGISSPYNQTILKYSDYDVEDIWPGTINHKHSIIFEDRHLIGDVYYDGREMPLRVFYSNPVNHLYAGHDIFPNYFDIVSGRGDRVMGFGQILNVLSIFTKHKILRYTFSEGIPHLQETPFEIGLVSHDSLIEYNGLYYFLGRRGITLNVYVYDGIHKPKEISKVIAGEIKIALERDGVPEEQVIGFIDTVSNQYRLVVNAYE